MRFMLTKSAYYIQSKIEKTTVPRQQ